MAADFVENWKEHDTPLTEDERSLLEDMKATIDFAFEKGLGFKFVSHVLGHDFQEVAQVGSLQVALSRGFLPKAHGFSRQGRGG